MGEVGEAYRGCRGRITEMTARLDEAAAEAFVPTCPDWTIHDVVAHVTGVVDDALSGRMDGVGSDPWAAAQVGARRDNSLSEILEEWAGKAPIFEEVLDSVPRGRQAVFDLVNHEHDIRLALRSPGFRSSDAVQIGFGFAAPIFIDSAAAAGVILEIRDEAGTRFGTDAPVSLEASAFEVMRAITGRRSPAQIAAMRWQGDWEPVMPLFSSGPFRPCPTAVEE